MSSGLPWDKPKGNIAQALGRAFEAGAVAAPEAQPDNPVGEFLDVLVGAGLEIDGLPAGDGKLHRVKSKDDKRGERSGWYVLYLDGGWPAGAYGDWKSGISENWRAQADKAMAAEQEREYRENMARAKAAREAERERLQVEAAETASRLIGESKPADGHSYLKRKGVQGYGVLFDGARLVVPMMDVDGVLHSVQFIDADGDKRYLTGGRKRACFYPIGKPGDVICVCEGFATGASVHEATGYPVAVAFDSGNLQPVAEALRARFPAVSILICGDDDRAKAENAGRAKAEAAAQAADAVAVFPDFGDDPAGTDFNDLALSKGADAVRDQIFAALPAAKTVAPLGGFDLVSAADLELQAAAPRWLIKGLLECNSFAVLFGQPAAGKTFVALAKAISIASGRDFFGLKVRNPGPVIYLAGEGHSGISRRLRAQALHSGEKIPRTLFISTMAAPLMNEAAAAEVSHKVAEIAEQHGQPALVIVDTLARHISPGDENANDDMGAFVHVLDQMRNRFGCAVMVVHHTGHGDKGRARGASALPGAADFMIAARRDANGSLSLSTMAEDGGKTKDCKAMQPMFYTLHEVDLGMIDEDGDPVTSAVPVLSDDQAPMRPAKDLPKGQKRVLDALKRAIGKSGFAAPDHFSEVDRGTLIVGLEIWRSEAYAAEITDGDSDTAKRNAFNRAKRELTECGRVGSGNGYFWLADPGEASAAALTRKITTEDQSDDQGD